MDFTFEILDETTINVRFNYGGEWFEFNLFHRDNQWILHPYDASLLGNPDMCRLVIADLLANKPFQVMLAKERIILSQLRTSVDVSGSRQVNPPERGFEDHWDEDYGERRRTDRDRRNDRDQEPQDAIDEWIRDHSFGEILEMELQGIESRLQLYNVLLQKMFYENLGPGNIEFDKIQEIARIYKEAAGKVKGLIDPNTGHLGDGSSGRRRF